MTIQQYDHEPPRWYEISSNFYAFLGAVSAIGLAALITWTLTIDAARKAERQSVEHQKASTATTLDLCSVRLPLMSGRMVKTEGEVLYWRNSMEDGGMDLYLVRELIETRDLCSVIVHLPRTVPETTWIPVSGESVAVCGLIQLVFGDIPGLAFANMKKENPQLFKEALGHIIEQTPAHFMGNVHKDNTIGWSTDAVPALAKPVVEIATNYDTWRDQPLEGQYTHQRSPELRYTERTSPTMKLLGEKIKESPIMLQHLEEGYLPGYGQLPLKGADWMLGKNPFKGDLRDAPVVGGFVEPPPIGFQSEPVMMVLNKAKNASADLSAVKRLAKGKSPAEVAELKKKYPLALQSPMLNRASEQLNDLYSLREDTLADSRLTDEQRKDKILQIDQRVSQIASQALEFLEHFEELRKNPFAGMIGGTR